MNRIAIAIVTVAIVFSGESYAGGGGNRATPWTPYPPGVRMPEWQSHNIKAAHLPPGAKMSDYELDHCIPLCLGGSNDLSNLQMQPIGDALRKDDDERNYCMLVKRGLMPREGAIASISTKWPCQSLKQ